MPMSIESRQYIVDMIYITVTMGLLAPGILELRVTTLLLLSERALPFYAAEMACRDFSRGE